MKLFYYECGKNNFGDVLNPWFWQEQLNIKFDKDDHEIMVGVGTLINNRIPDAQKVHIMGSGAGYGDYVPKMKDNWQVHCVRGPFTAKALGVSKKLVTSDPVIYLNRLVKLSTNKKYRCGFMPHYGIESKRFENICSSVGIHYISPSKNRDDIINDVNNCEKLICSAMHGAILAEALRVPWLPVNTSEEILPFKWIDFCSSLHLEYAPSKLPIIWQYVSNNLIKKQTAKIKDYYCAKLLRDLSNSRKFILSEQSILDENNNKFEDTVEKFKHQR